MKKSQRPFTFEIKRSRLPASTSSTFQRYVVPADPSTARKIPAELATNIASASLAGSLPSRRILPSLSQRMTWLEESVPAAPEAAEAIHVSEWDQSDDSMPTSMSPASWRRLAHRMQLSMVPGHGGGLETLGERLPTCRGLSVGSVACHKRHGELTGSLKPFGFPAEQSFAAKIGVGRSRSGQADRQQQSASSEDWSPSLVPNHGLHSPTGTDKP
jgi:hypothetical protein